MPEWFTALFTSPLASALTQLALITLLTVSAFLVRRVILRRIDRSLMRPALHREHLDRLLMGSQAGRSVSAIWMLIIFSLMALNVRNVDLGPLLAGAGLAGLALSPGAQSLIKDFICGILVLIEGSYVVGDTISVGNLSGAARARQ